MSNNISKKAVIYPNVSLGPGAVVEDFAIIGARGSAKGPAPKTVIGRGCHIRSFTVIYAGNVIGKDFKTGNKTNIREDNTIGDNVSIGTLSVIEHHVKIGDGTRIHTQAFVPEYTVLGNGCWIGPNVVFTNARYPNTPTTKDNLAGAVVEDGARVGANSTILPGVTLGTGCLIGAGSVVTKDVLPQGLYFGNPAKLKGWICACGNGLKASGKVLSCLHCKKTYRKSVGGIREI